MAVAIHSLDPLECKWWNSEIWEDIMKHRWLILALVICLSWGLFFTCASPLPAKIRMRAPVDGWPELVKLNTDELVQRFVSESEEWDMDNMLGDEITRRLKRGSPEDRAEVISVLLSFAQDATQEPDHRCVAIARLSWVSVPVVAGAFTAIAMDYREDGSVRRTAISDLPQTARSHKSLTKKVCSALVRIVHTTDDFSGDFDLIARAIRSIGKCGDVGAEALLKFWNSKRFRKQISTYRSDFFWAFGYTGDTRALDFLLARLEEADLTEDCRELFDGLGYLGRRFGGQTIFWEPCEPDLASYSKVEAALEKGVRLSTHPGTKSAASWWLADITRRRTMKK